MLYGSTLTHKYTYLSEEAPLGSLMVQTMDRRNDLLMCKLRQEAPHTGTLGMEVYYIIITFHGTNSSRKRSSNGSNSLFVEGTHTYDTYTLIHVDLVLCIFIAAYMSSAPVIYSNLMPECNHPGRQLFDYDFDAALS